MFFAGVWLKLYLWFGFVLLFPLVWLCLIWCDTILSGCLFCLFSCHSIIAFVLFPYFFVSVFQVCMLQKSTEIEDKTWRTMYQYRQQVTEVIPVEVHMMQSTTATISRGLLTSLTRKARFVLCLFGMVWCGLV